MAETDAASPWGPRPDAPAPADPAAAPPRSMWREIAWGALSTALLAAFVGWQLGWLAAVAIVAGVFVHEFGHVLVINWAGCGPSSIRIIPFLGGAATMKKAPESEFKAVLIALAGPAAGLAAALPFFALAAATQQRAWLAGAFFVGVLNLVNLAPAPPLDGAKALGPVLARLHPALERAALVLVGALAVVWGVARGSYIFAVFVGLSVVGAAMSRNLRAPARPLGWPQWGASLGLYGAVLALAIAVVLLSLGGAPQRLMAFIAGRA
ncbi:MAG TPA: site-2 protease family protein [Caulobacteraceae bacterium]|nr:site-2 protease family protein [Caulobacteraceae bacterium]